MRSTDGAAVLPPDLLAEARAIAHLLQLQGLQPDEPVLAGLGNVPRDLAAMLAVWLAGGVVVPVSAQAPPPAVSALRGVTGARFRVENGQLRAEAAALPPRRPLLEGAALVIFTSGSTGTPKGVVIGHERMAAKLDVLDRLLEPGTGDVVVVPLRLTFIFGLWVSLLTLRQAAHLMLVPKFTREIVARCLGERATVLAAVPTMLRALLSQGAPAAPALRAIFTGGESLGAPLAARLRAQLPQAGLYDLYGSTETGSCDFCQPPADHAVAPGSIGRPTDQVAFRLLGSGGSATLTGSEGELCVSTPFGMLGYLDDPALTAASFSEGYFRTGDLARLRPDGRVGIVGRLKEIISRGGNKIAPAEIETLLCAHPDVADALCAGVPDDRLGEAIHAIVVPRANTAPAPEALRRWAAERIERYKVPDAIYVRDALPLGSTGKVRRAGVAELAAAARAGSQGR